jgi:hypothetical protein
MLKMEQNIKYGARTMAKAGKQNYGYLLMSLLLAVILPLLSVLWEHYYELEPYGWELIGKWFIFYAIGIRLFTAGISQASNPAFTSSILHLKTRESFVVIRELGFANLSLGVMGILSALNNNWRVLAAISGGLFFGLAGILHLLRKPETRNEMIAMCYDLFVMVVIIFFLYMTLFF